MALPPMRATAEKGERSEAADLFYDRAGRVLPAYPHQAGDLATVNRLCERLDGLPLAIELAAPWVRTLSARDLLTEIERSADLLASTHPTLTGRHQQHAGRLGQHVALVDRRRAASSQRSERVPRRVHR